ncbi:hypothetical protein CsatA_010498 [Cannabis sativa]
MQKKRDLNIKEKAVRQYRMEGFPFAYQVWLYEVLPILKREDIFSYDPAPTFRICRWTSSSSPNSNKLEKKVFSSSKLKAVPMEPTDAEKDLLDLSEFEWYGLSVSDDDFVGPAMPKKVVKGQTSGVQNMSEKVAKDVLEGVSNSILKDMKDSLAVISDHQKTTIDAWLLEFKKTIEEKFLEFEKSIKSYIDCKIEDGLKVHLDMRFEVLKNLIAGRSESVAYDDFSGDDTDVDFDPETKDDEKVII